MSRSRLALVNLNNFSPRHTIYHSGMVVHQTHRVTGNEKSEWRASRFSDTVPYSRHTHCRHWVRILPTIFLFNFFLTYVPRIPSSLCQGSCSLQGRFGKTDGPCSILNPRDYDLHLRLRGLIHVTSIIRLLLYRHVSGCSIFVAGCIRRISQDMSLRS